MFANPVAHSTQTKDTHFADNNEHFILVSLFKQASGKMFHSIIGSGNVGSWSGRSSRTTEEGVASDRYARIVAEGGTITVEGKEYKADDIELKGCLDLGDGKQIFFMLTDLPAIHVEAKHVSISSASASVTVHINRECTINKIVTMSGDVKVNGSANGPVTIETVKTMSGDVVTGRHASYRPHRRRRA